MYKLLNKNWHRLIYQVNIVIVKIKLMVKNKNLLIDLIFSDNQGVQSRFHPPYWKSLTDSCWPFFYKSKLLYICGSHAKGDSQKFEIEEIEEPWNSRQKLEKKSGRKEKFITWSNLNILNCRFLQTASFFLVLNESAIKYCVIFQKPI